MRALQLLWSLLPQGLCTCCSHCLEGLIRSHITLLVAIHPFGVSGDISPGKPFLGSQNRIEVPRGHSYGNLNSHPMMLISLCTCLSSLYCTLPENKEDISPLPCPHHLTQCLIISGHLLNTMEKNQCLYALNAYCVPDTY